MTILLVKLQGTSSDIFGQYTLRSSPATGFVIVDAAGLSDG